LRRLQEERNSAIIFITHDLGVIAQMAHYVTVMYLGVVVEQGPVDDIFHAQSTRTRRRCWKSIPSIDMTARADLPTISGSIPHPFNRPRAARSTRAAPASWRASATRRRPRCKLLAARSVSPASSTTTYPAVEASA
jgi:ABC-type dipeptide/oligopeptide/nickel transport system ATPase component